MNLSTVDVMGIYEFCQLGPQLIVAPIVILFSLVFVFIEIGYSALTLILIVVCGLYL